MRKLLPILTILLVTNSISAQTKGKNPKPFGGGSNKYAGKNWVKDTSANVNLPRKRLTSLRAEDIQSNEKCKISFTLTVDAEGNIVNAQVVRSMSTTEDEVLIKQIKQLIQEQIKYEKISGAELQKIKYAVSITGN